MQLPTLYGYDQKGRLKIWKIRTEGARIIAESGLEGGVMTPSFSSGEAKNIGRANEQSAAENAITKAQSKWNDKKKSQYRESIEELENLGLLPQLALDFLKAGHRAKFPAIAQPKLNGMRGLRNVDKKAFISRKGNKIRTMANIEEQIRWLSLNCPYWHKAIDGEFYIHGFYLSDIISLVKREQRDSALVEFHIFDFAIENEQQETRLDRLMFVAGWMEKHKEACETYARNIKIVPCKRVNSMEEFVAYQMECESQGYEGAMLRSPTAKYKSGPAKTTAIFKRKSFQDAEFTTLDITEGEEGRAILHFETKDGRPFKAELIGSDEVTQEVVRNKARYIGQPATVKFQELSKYGVPSIGVKALAFRNYE